MKILFLPHSLEHVFSIHVCKSRDTRLKTWLLVTALVTKHSFFLWKCDPHEVSHLICTQVIPSCVLQTPEYNSAQGRHSVSPISWPGQREDGAKMESPPEGRNIVYSVLHLIPSSLMNNYQRFCRWALNFMFSSFVIITKINIKDIIFLLFTYVCLWIYLCICAHQSFCLYVCVMNVLVHTYVHTRPHQLS